MNAIKFIQQNGVDKAREVVEGAPERATHLLNGEYVRVSDPRWILDGYVSIEDLKRLVESVDLIKSFGSVRDVESLFNVDEVGRAKMMRVGSLYWHDAKQAIADYEAIGGEHV